MIGYIIYVGSLLYYDKVGGKAFPIIGGVFDGISAGFLFVASGSISTAYPEEKEKGSYITWNLNLQAGGSIIGTFIALVINRDATKAAGVPLTVYIILMVLMGLAGLMSLTLIPPHKLRRKDGSQVVLRQSRGFLAELKTNLLIFTDWKLMLMVPAFLPAECYLVYGGSTNAFQNNLRSRCLLSFCAVVLQIPGGLGMQWLVDHHRWRRRTRVLAGLAYIGVPLMAAWIWEIVEARDFNRQKPPPPQDWSDPGFVATFFRFMLQWVPSVLYHYYILVMLGTLTNDPTTLAHYSGVFRGFLGAGEAIAFGVDSVKVPYIIESGVSFCFYAIGLMVFAYLCLFQVEESRYFKEKNVVVPNHVVMEETVVGNPSKAQADSTENPESTK